MEIDFPWKLVFHRVMTSSQVYLDPKGRFEVANDVLNCTDVASLTTSSITAGFRA